MIFKKKIFLCGFMGCGKTAVGKKLSGRLNCGFKDTDTLIENLEKKSVSQIFESKGESYFRSLETAVLSDIASNPDKIEVISTGGGIVLSHVNFDIMNKCGLTVYLSAESETIADRVNPNTRPLLKNLTPCQLKNKINDMLDFRKEKYENCGIIIKTDNLTIDEVVETLILKIESKIAL
ncbi:MAG TPA: shikimate kinase [bacterium]|nr:shikimate kinase [bacterium]HPN31417.1 shikimate kinase [bacterium]